MDELQIHNMRSIAMDGTISVNQLKFLERLFHQTAAGTGAASGYDASEQIAGLDQELSLIHI